jgi:hypothetical protein
MSSLCPAIGQSYNKPQVDESSDFAPAWGMSRPMRQVSFFRVRIDAAQEADERVLKEFIAKTKIRRIVPALIQDAVQKFWSIYVEYEENKKGFESRKESKVIHASCDLETIHRRYPRAYEKWTEEEDVRLKIEYGKGLGIRPLSEMFQRRPGSIRSRLRKLGLVK